MLFSAAKLRIFQKSHAQNLSPSMFKQLGLIVPFSLRPFIGLCPAYPGTLTE